MRVYRVTFDFGDGLECYVSVLAKDERDAAEIIRGIYGRDANIICMIICMEEREWEM